MDGAARQLRLALHAVVIDFENRDLGLLGVARIGIAFASWSFAIALGVYGFDAHGVVGVGLVAAIRLLPGALASPFAGLVADRYSRRLVLVFSSLAMAAVLAGTALAASLDASSAVIFVFPALFAIASCAYVPAEAALFPMLARTPQELSASNVNHAAMENAGFIVAAIVSGFLLTAISPEFVFSVAATVTVLTTVVLLALRKDHRPVYYKEEISSIVRDTTAGLREIAAQPAVRLASTTLIVLLLFEGFADVVLVVTALHLLHLPEGSVGFLNASWGLGAVVGGAVLALLLDRGRLVPAIAGGSVVLGAATMLPGVWPHEAATYLAWFGIGVGFVFVEVAAKTLMQRLSSDETIGRVVSSLEAGRLLAMALGSLGAILLIEVLHERGALIALGALMPLFVLACWSRLRGYEIGAPVAEVPYGLLRGNSIFAPLPVATVERLSHDLAPVKVPAEVDVVVEGTRGDRFFLIEEGEVAIFEDGRFRRKEGPGESFGEIALLRDVARTATVRTLVPTRLLALERDQFLLAVTGHQRSHQVAHTVVDDRWSAPVPAPDGDRTA